MAIRTMAWKCLIVSLASSAALAQKVFRNVKDYGAVGDGVADDSLAIIRALTEQRADHPSDVYPNAKYSPSTAHPASIYFPSGTYKVTQTLPVIYYTEIVGDFENLPVIKFVSDSTDDQRVLDSFGHWFDDVSQNNFYRQIRNFVIDMTDCRQCTGIHWQVSQATSISNVVFKSKVGSENQGMFMENGSGGFFSDLVFEGGKYGMWLGNQQFTIRNITVRDTSSAAVFLYWDWVWTFKGLHVFNSPIGIDCGSSVGSLSVIDSDFANIGKAAIRTVYDKSQPNSANSLMLDNVKFNVAVGTALVQNIYGEKPLVAQAESTVIKAWGQGHVWHASQSVNEEIDLASSVQRNALLNKAGTDSYFEKARPLYAEADVMDVSSLGIVGDGVTDVADRLQQALTNYANKKALFLPHGIYIISKTVYVPAGSRIFGQAWSVLMAKGDAFQNPHGPVPMIQVGKAGEQGVAEISGVLFSTYGPQTGAILVQWNMHDPVGQQGACGMWDSHFRIGGAIGTVIRNTNCPKGDGLAAPASACAGAYLLMHLTPSSSLYMENVWGWVADHDIDATSQINVYNARGFLSESAGPLWMYGTAMEHSVLYQYNFVNSANVVMFTIQTETPYFQPSKNTPFQSIRTAPTDPVFCNDDARCEMAYGLHIANSKNIALYGTGMYSFFNVWDQACLSKSGGANCQKDVAKITNSPNSVQIFNLNTYGVVDMQENEGAFATAAQNPNTFCASRLFSQDSASAVI